MNRPHFPIAVQTGMGAKFTWNATAADHSLAGLKAAGSNNGTAIENLRRLMATETAMSADRVAELRDRVASGAYLSRNAAELTASRMLDENFDLN